MENSDSEDINTNLPITSDDLDYVGVIFLENVPSFIGIDGKNYGTFIAGSKALIPLPNALVCIKNKLAQVDEEWLREVILERVKNGVTPQDAISQLQEEWDAELSEFNLRVEDCIPKVVWKNVERTVTSNSEELPIIWEEDLQNIEANQVEWRVEGYIPEKSITMFAGKRSTFKSWAALHIAIAIATGQKAFGKFNTNKATVLYIDEENGIQEIKRKVEMIKLGMGISGPIKNLGFICYEGLKLESPESRVKLEKFLEEHDSVVIIADTFRRIITTEENDATEMNRVFTDIIRPMQKKYNVTWIFIHHLRKGISGKVPSDMLDELRGSSEITNVADSILIFDRPPRTTDRFVLRHAKARRAKESDPQLIELQWDALANSLKLECMGTAEELLNTIELCAKDIMVWLEENNIAEFKTREVKTAMKSSGYTSKTVDRALGELVLQGKIRKVKRGHYRREIETLKHFAENRDN